MSVLEHLEHVRLMRIEPGDVVIARVDEHSPREAIHPIKEDLQKVFPDNQVVVCRGVDLSIARLVEDETDT